MFSLLMQNLSLMASSTLFVSNLPFKEGIVEYKISGNDKGKVIAYFKNWGKNIALYQDIKSPIIKKDSYIKTISIIDDKTLITIDLIKNKAIKIPTLQAQILEIFTNLDQQSQEYILDYPSDEVLDLECKSIEYKGIKECYNGALLLSRDISIFGYNSHIRATKIEERSVDESYFHIPIDIDIEDKVADFNKAKTIIESMLE